MYLKSVHIENVGPITKLKFDLPFKDDKPQPLVLVGPNGSGKTTVLSYIVNALVGLKQQAFANAEVEQQQVYRMRGASFIRHGASWSHVELDFNAQMKLVEWVIDRPRAMFEAEVKPLPNHEGWKSIPADDFSIHTLTPEPTHPLQRIPSKHVQEQFAKNVVLYFPSDRSEVPNWLNERALMEDRSFSEPKAVHGETRRRIFSRALLKPTLQWIRSVILDQLLYERMGEIAIRENTIFSFVSLVLASVLDADNLAIGFCLNNRHDDKISFQYRRKGMNLSIPDLRGLSAGQAEVFCTFCNIIRDFDQTNAPFEKTSDVRGAVIFDEADLHLHLDLQYRVVPELMKLFPNVQFILTTHSPLLLMGMRKAFGNEEFQICDIPSGKLIDTEQFSEFDGAINAFIDTAKFDEIVLEKIVQGSKPLLVTEGKFDVIHVAEAWRKLYDNKEMPFDVVSCGSSAHSKEDKGGAKMLRTMLQSLILSTQRLVIGLFDHDEEGVAIFNSLTANDGFVRGCDPVHAVHSSVCVNAILLPVPCGREKFVSTNPRSCFLAIEHYYTDDILDRFGVKDAPVVDDSSVFRIQGAKANFAKNITSLDKKQFANFELLFQRLKTLIGMQTSTTLSPLQLDADPQYHTQTDVMMTPYSSTDNPPESQLVTPDQAEKSGSNAQSELEDMSSSSS